MVLPGKGPGAPSVHRSSMRIFKDPIGMRGCQVRPQQQTCSNQDRINVRIRISQEGLSNVSKEHLVTACYSYPCRIQPRTDRPRFPPGQKTMLRLTQLYYYLTLKGSFSAVSKPAFASKYSWEGLRRDLQHALLCTVL